jgi:hypothetical protein
MHVQCPLKGELLASKLETEMQLWLPRDSSQGDLKCKWAESRELRQMRRHRDAIRRGLGYCMSKRRNKQVFSESICMLVTNSLPHAHVSVSFVCFIEMAREVDEDSEFVFVRLLTEHWPCLCLDRPLRCGRRVDCFWLGESFLWDGVSGDSNREQTC